MCFGGGGDNDIEDTPEQRYLAQVAAEKWNFAQDKLAPLEDAYMEQVGDMTSPANMSYIRGRTMQSQQQTTSDLMGQASGRLTQAGIDPSSGRYQASMKGLTLGAAEAGGETLGRAQFEQENQQIQGLQNIVAMGQGEATQAQAGLAGIADQASADARSSAVNSFNRNNANLQLLGTVAGAGARYGLQGAGAGGGVATPGFQAGQGLDLYGGV